MLKKLPFFLPVRVEWGWGVVREVRLGVKGHRVKEEVKNNQGEKE